MNSFKYRPLAVFSITFYVAACIFSETGTKELLAAVFAAGALATAVFIIPKLKTRVSILPALVSFALSFAALFSLFTVVLPEEENEKLTGEKVVYGEVLSTVWSDGEGGLFIADAVIGEKEARLFVSVNEYLSRGDRFCAVADISPLGEYTDYYRSEGVDLKAEIETLERLESREENESDKFYALNQRLSAIFAVKLGRENGGFASSVLLGNRDNLSLKLRSDLQTMGISHLIALSGLHLTVICGMAYALLRPLRRSINTIAAIATAVFYMLLTDFSASIVRAAVMLIFFCIIRLAKRSADGATAIGFTALIVTLISPETVFDTGFQLSCAAVGGVYCALDYIEGNWYDELTTAKVAVKKLITPVAVGFGATLFVLPVLILNGEAVTFAGVLVTVPMSALLSLIMWMLPPLLILPFDFWQDTVSFLIDVFESAAEFFARFGDYRLLCENYVLGAVLCAFAACGFVLALGVKKKKVKRAIICISALLLCVFTGLCAENSLAASQRVAVIAEEYSRGDVLILQDGGHTVIFDVTSAERDIYEDVSEKVLSLGDTKIDAVVIADPRTDHFAALAKSGIIYGADAVFMPKNEISLQLAYFMEDYTTVVFYGEGEEVSFDTVTFTALPTLRTSRSLLPSLAFTVTVNGETVVYAGSAYEELGGEIPQCDRLWRGSYGPKEKE